MNSNSILPSRSLGSTFLANVFHMNLKSVALTLLASVVALTICVPAFARGATVEKNDNFTLTIIHTNDVHANYDGFKADNHICYEDICKGGYGGALRLQRDVKALKRQYPQALVMDAGDQFLGTLFWTIHKEVATLAVMNAIGYQFFVPGNHEFDDGHLTFKKLVDNLVTQVLAANLVINDPSLSMPKISPYTIVNINGRKVAVIGLITEDSDVSRSLISGTKGKIPFTLLKEKATLSSMIKKINEQGVDIIVLLSHIGLPRDLAYASELDGLDIIVGGHTHNFLGDVLDSEGPYPIVVNSPKGDPVLVVTTGSSGSYLGLLNVQFDEQGRAIKWSGAPLHLDDQTLSRLKAPPIDHQL
ncbi:MAG: metallophosphoesterase, partial [Clostridiales Family XIII bacterium]|nr:metallophosphoesterase [Clostridiales Family XIII bacterium]